MKKRFFKFFIFILLLSFNSPAFSASTTTHNPEPYGENEFPLWLKDLRRAEIITLGAMPFVTLNVTLGYWAINGFDTNLNPFEGTSDTTTKYTNDQTFGIILTSLGICAGIGLTDFIVHLLKTTSQTTSKQKKHRSIDIESVVNDPEAVKLPPPEAEMKTFIENEE